MIPSEGGKMPYLMWRRGFGSYGSVVYILREESRADSTDCAVGHMMVKKRREERKVRGKVKRKEGS